LLKKPRPPPKKKTFKKTKETHTDLKIKVLRFILTDALDVACFIKIEAVGNTKK